jgi:hypothetical protein
MAASTTSVAFHAYKESRGTARVYGGLAFPYCARCARHANWYETSTSANLGAGVLLALLPALAANYLLLEVLAGVFDEQNQ